MNVPNIIKSMLPKVVNSRNRETKFRPIKIIRSLLKETNLDLTIAIIIARSVVKKIIVGNVKILTSPEIREIVCGTLVELGYEKERFYYTRLGYPYRDFQELYNSKVERKKDMFFEAEIRLDKEIIKNKIFNHLVGEYEGINKIYKSKF